MGGRLKKYLTDFLSLIVSSIASAKTIEASSSSEKRATSARFFEEKNPTGNSDFFLNSRNIAYTASRVFWLDTSHSQYTQTSLSLIDRLHFFTKPPNEQFEISKPQNSDL